MKQKIFNEITFSIILIVLSVLFLDPFMLLMSGSMIYILLVTIITIFAILVGLIWKEKVIDERDELHRRIASRVGYISGVGVLIIGIVWQTIFSHPDYWIVIALVFMVLGKLIGLFYSRSKY